VVEFHFYRDFYSLKRILEKSNWC